jgi:GTPase-activating protein BEM2
MEKLQMIEKEVLAFDFDLRSIRSDAIRDGSQTPSSKKGGVRPFGRLVLAQHEKNRRDRALRDRLLKEKKAEQYRTERREHQLDRAMHVKARPNASGRGQHRTKKSTSSAFAFLQFMRPISTAFSSDSVTSNPPKRTAEELDFVPSGKPSLVLTVADAKMLKFINNERPYTFQVDTEDGGHYLFQATSQKEMAKWMSSVGHVSQVAAKRRLTWIGDAPQLQDHVSDRPKVVAKEPTAIFGVDLTALLRRENHGEDPPAGTLPIFIQTCLAEIESRGFSEVGICKCPVLLDSLNI